MRAESQKRQSPGATGLRGKSQSSNAIDHTRTGRGGHRLPDNWRARLPAPDVYYPRHVEKLSRPNGKGWAQGPCPFHEDGNASLSVNLVGDRGAWRCFAGCGAGDLVGFHLRRTGLTFVDAVRDLVDGGVR